MLDQNWDLIDGNVAHEIEVLNYSNQVNVIEALVRFILHHAGAAAGASCPQLPTEKALKELHRTGTLFLLAEPGVYRTEQVWVKKGDGTIVHTPPPPEEVQSNMDGFFAELMSMWNEADAIGIAAYCLWMLNWVHPFKNGNGRTARGFSYACLSLKLGFVLPGSPTVIDLVMSNRPEYQAALKEADVGYEKTGKANLARMNAFIGNLLVMQLQSVPTA